MEQLEAELKESAAKAKQWKADTERERKETERKESERIEEIQRLETQQKELLQTMAVHKQTASRTVDDLKERLEKEIESDRELVAILGAELLEPSHLISMAARDLDEYHLSRLELRRLGRPRHLELLQQGSQHRAEDAGVELDQPRLEVLDEGADGLEHLPGSLCEVLKVVLELHQLTVQLLRDLTPSAPPS